MKKFLTAMIVLMLFASIGCSKKSLADGLNDAGGNSSGGGTGGTATDSKGPANYQYLGYMYDSQNGAQLTSEVFNTTGYFKDHEAEIRKALNLLMSFKGTGGANVSFNWYDTLPASIKTYVAQANGDFSLGYANFLRSDEGKAYMKDQLDKAIAKLTVMKNFDPANPSSDPAANPFLANSTLDNTTKSFMENALIGGTEIAASIALMYCGVDPGLATTFSSFGGSIVSNILGFGGSTPDPAIMAKLNQIISMLGQIQDKLKTIEEKIDRLIDYTTYSYYLPFTNALNLLEGIYNTLAAIPLTRLDDRRTIVVRDLSNLSQAVLDAYGAASLTLSNTKDSVGTQAINGVTVNIYKCQNYSGIFNGTCTLYKSLSYSVKMPAYYMNVTLKDIEGLMRLSLGRIHLAEEMYSGSDLLYNRKVMAEQDLAILQEIKNSFNAVSTAISTEINQYGFLQAVPNAGELMFNLDAIGFKISFSDINQNNSTSFYAGMNGFGTNLSFTCPIAVGENSCIWQAIIPAENIISYDFDSALRQSLSNYINNTSSTNKFKDYMTMTAATLAQWELELRAHIKAYEARK